jgi:hypothetical protein
MIIEFIPEKIGISACPHYLNGYIEESQDFWRISLNKGLNQLSLIDEKRLRSYPDLEIYLNKGAIVIRDDPETPFQRTLELEELYKSQGYSAIATLAIKFGIPKPTSGWKDAIPLIVQAESEVA